MISECEFQEGAHKSPSPCTQSNEWFFVVLKQMGMGNAGKWIPGFFVVILLSYSYTGMSNLFSYNFFKIPESAWLACNNNNAH